MDPEFVNETPENPNPAVSSDLLHVLVDMDTEFVNGKPENPNHAVSSDHLHGPVDDMEVEVTDTETEHVLHQSLSTPFTLSNPLRLKESEEKESENLIEKQDFRATPTILASLETLQHPSISTEERLIASPVKTINISPKSSSSSLYTSSENNENVMYTTAFLQESCSKTKTDTVSEKSLIVYSPENVTSCNFRRSSSSSFYTSSENNKNLMNTTAFPQNESCSNTKKDTVFKKSLIVYSSETGTSCKNSFSVETNSKLKLEKNNLTAKKIITHDKKTPKKRMLSDFISDENASSSLEEVSSVASISCIKSNSKNEVSSSHLKKKYKAPFYSSNAKVALNNSQKKEFHKTTGFRQHLLRKNVSDKFSAYLTPSKFCICSETIKNEKEIDREKDTDKKSKFARIVVGSSKGKAFEAFLDFLINKEKGIKCFEALKREEKYISSMSSMLTPAGLNAQKAFEDLYKYYFDDKGNKTLYLTKLEENKVDIRRMSSILNHSGAQASEAFKELYDLWFDEEGRKNPHLRILEENKIDLARMSSILKGSGMKAVESFEGLYNLWFDNQGNKAKHLKTLEKEKVNLSNISSILNGAGANAKEAFIALYNLWFDNQGNKTRYLKILEKEKVNLSNVSCILSGAGANAEKAFKDLYDFWFDDKGNKTKCLKTLEKEKINLSNISNILNGAGVNAKKAFELLYNLWFDNQGNRTRYVKTLEKEVNISNVSCILSGAGANVEKAFKALYNLWFDKQGNKTKYLSALEEEGLNLSYISDIFNRAGAKAPNAFEALCKLWFNVDGSKTQYLTKLEESGVNLVQIFNILKGTGNKAIKVFADFYNRRFNKKRTDTGYLEALY